MKTAEIVNEAIKLVSSENNGEKIQDWDAYILKREADRLLNERKERWNKICPPLYKETDIKKIDRKRLEKVMSWNPKDGRNLWIKGETGKQKTRMAFLLIEKLLFEGYSVEAINAVELGIKLSQPVWDGKEKELERLSRYSVLLIDDLGKEPDTQSISQYLYLLVEKRYSHKKLTIITSNQLQLKEAQRPTYRRLFENAKCAEVV